MQHDRVQRFAQPSFPGNRLVGTGAARLTISLVDESPVR